jgi:GNAT superfamily N-acetyltransferase
LEPPPAGRFPRAHLHRPHSTKSRSSTYLKLPSLLGTHKPIGFAYGIALPTTTRWWATIRPPVTDPTFTREHGHRTFALFEIIVKPEHQGQGTGRRIHDDLLAKRSEQRVTIATHRGNTHAWNTYTKWGYRHIGTRQPAPPAPLLDVFLRARVYSANGDH